MLDKPSKPKKSERVDIVADTVKQAARLASAAVGSSQIFDLCVPKT